jgi:hypothetical protein
MGKPSKIKSPFKDTGTRFSYPNGDRKLYDRDKKPDGLDSDIWNLVLYFGQLAETYGYPAPARPVMYTELYHRIMEDKDFSGILVSGLDKPGSGVLFTGKCSICGIDCTLLGFTSIDSFIAYILTSMIELYWTTNNDYDYNYSINDFCSITIFNYLKDYVVDSLKRRILISTGIRTVEEDRPVKPSKKTVEEKEIASIKLRKHGQYTEEELKEKFRDFKDQHNV